MTACEHGITRVLLLASLLWAGAAHSVIILDSRTSSYDITGLSGNFSGAVVDYGILASGRAEATPASQGLAFSTKSLAAGVSISAGGVFGSSFTVQNATLIDVVLTAGADGAGTANLGYSTVASDDFSKTWIVRGSEPGFSTLHFIGGGFGFVPIPLDPNDGVDRVAFFDVFITLEGDWSALGAGAGQLEFIGIDSAWTIDQFFEFDGTATRFHALNRTYTENDYNVVRTPNVDFILRLAAVPEPGSVGILLLGLTALGFVRRRKSAATGHNLD